MKASEINNAFNNLSAEIQNLSESDHKPILLKLLNLVETLVLENKRLSEENQQLRDKNNRLKGEQGKPNKENLAPISNH